MPNEIENPLGGGEAPDTPASKIVVEDAVVGEDGIRRLSDGRAILTPAEVLARQEPVSAMSPTLQLEAMHPEISVVDRAALKTFVDDPEEMGRYLAREQGFSYEVDKEGALSVWKSADKFKYRLDPEGLDLWDTVDVIAPVLDFGAQTAATLTKAGGAALAPATGATSIPLSMAAGAGITGSAETARQSLGQILGYREGYDEAQIATVTAAGAFIPGAMGVGKKLAETGAGKAIAEFGKELAKKGAAKTAKTIGDLDWKKMMFDSPESLAKAVSNNPKFFLEDSGKMLSDTITRLLTARERLGKKIMTTEIFRKVKTNKELFSLVKQESDFLGENIGKLYRGFDEHLLPRFLPSERTGFKFSDVEPFVRRRLAKAKGANKNVDVTDAIEKAGEHIKRSMADGEVPMTGMWHLRISYDEGVHFVDGAQDFVGKQQVEQARIAGNIMRDFIAETFDRATNSGNMQKGVVKALKENGQDFPEMFLNPSGQLSKVAIRGGRELYGDLQLIRHLADAGNALATGSAKSPTLYSPIFGAVRFGYYTGANLWKTPWGRYLRHRVATGETTPQQALMMFKEYTQKMPATRIGRTLVSVKDNAGAFVDRATQHPVFYDFLQRMGYGVSAEAYFSDVLDEGNAEVLAETAAAMPDLFEEGKAYGVRIPSLMQGRVYRAEDREKIIQRIEEDRLLQPSQITRIENALNKTKELIFPEKPRVSSTKPQKQPDLNEKDLNPSNE